MTQNTQRHPFLDDLNEDVTLVSSVLRGELTGRDQVLKVVKAAGGLYRSQTPTFLGHADDRMFFQYEADLGNGLTASGMVSIIRDDNGGVSRLHIAFSPLGAVLSIAEGLKATVSDDLDADLFL
ncbi:hypothetical protein [Novosphingobium sp.]|uniref:hypothetical protein n=1 Tax=Novosphingobium sp. TaxID=1874826 RepID=UPI0031D4D2EA